MGRAHAVSLLGALVLLLGFTATVTAGAAQASQSRPAAGSVWQVEPTPNQDTTSAGVNQLSAVSCTSSRACTAVGSHAASVSSPSFTLAERWNGTSWRIQPTILPKGAQATGFHGVSCASASSCTAVGSAFVQATSRSVNLAEAWNGKSWRVQAIPTPKGSTGAGLNAVSCTSSSACTAVGFYDNSAGTVLPVAARWNGTAWRLETLPKAASTDLFGVSCSAALACTAVGYFPGSADAQPAAEVWNGTSWRIQKVPLPSGSPGGILSAVSCTSPNACTATGANFTATAPTLAERWNGTRWRIQATPFPANSGTSHQQVELNSVSCTSATACTATGAYAPGGNSDYFLEAWNGQRWQLVTAPHPVGFVAGAVNGVSCVPTRCTAAGAWSGGPISVATLAMAN